jgi:SAM-dependent methyltransferase
VWFSPVHENQFMYFCYVDESGTGGRLRSLDSPDAPLLSVVGVTVEEGQLTDLTRRLLLLKRTFFPHHCPPDEPLHTLISREIKGSHLRAAFKVGNKAPKGSTRGRRAHTQHDRSRAYALFFDTLLNDLAEFECRIFGMVWIKSVDADPPQWDAYDASMHHILRTFNAFLEERDDVGCVVPDPRSGIQNVKLALEFFRTKFSRRRGDPYARVKEIPVFGNSKWHAGVQIADFVCSGLIAPIAAYAYCYGYVRNETHFDRGFERLRKRYGIRLRRLQYRYRDASDQWAGGLEVNDELANRPADLLFEDRIHLVRETHGDMPDEIPDLFFAVLRTATEGMTKVLSLGCGDATWITKISTKGALIVGCERSSRLVTRTAHVSGVAHVNASANDLPFRRASFDGVIVLSAAFWLRDAHAFGEIERVLRPGGAVLVVDERDGRHFGSYKLTLQEFIPPEQTEVLARLSKSFEPRVILETLRLRDIRTNESEVQEPMDRDQAIAYVERTAEWERVPHSRKERAREYLLNWFSEHAAGNYLQRDVQILTAVGLKPLLVETDGGC